MKPKAYQRNLREAGHILRQSLAAVPAPIRERLPLWRHQSQVVHLLASCPWPKGTTKPKRMNTLARRLTEAAKDPAYLPQKLGRKGPKLLHVLHPCFDLRLLVDVSPVTHEVHLRDSALPLPTEHSLQLRLGNGCKDAPETYPVYRLSDLLAGDVGPTDPAAFFWYDDRPDPAPVSRDEAPYACGCFVPRQMCHIPIARFRDEESAREYLRKLRQLPHAIVYPPSDGDDEETYRPGREEFCMIKKE